MSYNNGPKIVRDGLTLCLDAANYKSFVSGSTTWYDLARPGFTGSLINGPTYTGSNQGALIFDGTNDYVSLPSSSLASSSQMTFALWNFGQSITNPRSVIYFENASGIRTLNVHLTYHGTIYFDAGNGSGNTGGAFDRINKGVTASELFGWQYWVFTKNATAGTMRIYRNGELWHSGGGSAPIGASVTGSLGASLSIGWYHVGHIGMAKLYSRELSAAEIRENYNATKGRYPAPSESLLLKDGFSPATQSWTLGPTFSITDKLYANASGTTTSSFFSFSTPVVGNLWMYCVFYNGAGGGGFGPQNVATIADSSGNIVAAIGYNRLGGRAFHLMNGVGSTVITTVSLDNTNYHLWLNCGTNSNIRGWVSTTSTRPATFAEMPRNSYAPMARFYATVPAVSDPNWDNIVISTTELGNNPF